MNESREFDLGDILTITTGRLVSPRHIEGVYDILGFLTGDSLYTHQLPRASRACKPLLLAQHPQLASVDASDCNAATWRDWLVRQKRQYGETLPVERLHEWQWESRDPLEELVEMVGEDKVIAIDVQPPNDHA